MTKIDFLAFLITSLIIITLVAFAGGLIAGPLLALNKAYCSQIASGMKTDYSFTILAGCRLKIKDKYIPLELIRQTDLGVK